MDGLFSLIWVAFIVVTIVNSVSNKNKKKQQQSQSSVPPFTAAPVTQQPKPMTEPPKPAVFREAQKWLTEQPKVQQTRMPLEAMQPAPAAQPPVAAPRVHAHLAPDCDIDGPSGSLDFISTEGVDPCHDDELPGRNTPRTSFPVMRERPGLTLEWTSDALVKSVVMQEILTRPSQRRRR